MKMKTALLIAVALAGCGDDVFHPASFPALVDHGGARLTTVNLVTIVYPNDPGKDQAIAFDEFVVGSDWLRTVGDEYGIHGGAHLATFTMPHDAPPLMDVNQLADDLLAAYDGVGPTSRDGVPAIYLIYLPASTVLDGELGVSCTDFGGYHRFFAPGGPAWAVIADCGGDRSVTASHEIIEAATDPYFDGLWVGGTNDHEDPWYFWPNTEVGDMCEFVIGPVDESGWKLQRSWSQAAAQAPRPDPCVPVPPGDVWSDLDTDPRTVLHANPGDHLDVALRAWASGPSDPWTVDLIVNTQSDFYPSVSISRSQYFDGDTGVLSIDVPPDAQYGQHAHVHLWSGGQLAPVEIVIGDITVITAPTSDAQRRRAGLRGGAGRGTNATWR